VGNTYGYNLIDAGPHPNPAKAAGGKRLHALAIDKLPAEVVGRIFGLFIAGHGIYAIAERLTAEGIPSPSAHDHGRNRHRAGLPGTSTPSGQPWPTPATPAARSGTGSARTRS